VLSENSGSAEQTEEQKIKDIVTEMTRAEWIFFTIWRQRNVLYNFIAYELLRVRIIVMGLINPQISKET